MDAVIWWGRTGKIYSWKTAASESRLRTPASQTKTSTPPQEPSLGILVSSELTGPTAKTAEPQSAAVATTALLRTVQAALRSLHLLVSITRNILIPLLTLAKTVSDVGSKISITHSLEHSQLVLCSHLDQIFDVH